MKRSAIHLSIVVLLFSALPSAAQERANIIGVALLSHLPDGGTQCVDRLVNPGIYDLSLILENAVGTDSTPLSTLAGFQLDLVVTSTFHSLEFILPEGVTNVAEAPSFKCTGAIPVVDGRAHLATIRVTIFENPVGDFFVRPLADEPAIPGSLSIFDAGAPDTPIAAGPASGDFERSLMMITNSCGISAEARSWSSLKAAHR